MIRAFLIIRIRIGPTELIQDTFEYPNLNLQNYGDQSEGWITAPQTGNYIFWVAADDSAQVWLSTNASPTNKVLIASVTSYTGQDQWNEYPSQQSAPIPLVQGNSYYLQVLHKNAGGADNLGIGWQKPDGTLEQPMSTLYYEPYSATNSTPIITQDPQSTSAADGQMVSFSVDLAPTAQPLSYQWYQGSTPIPGATLPGLTFRATLANSGAMYSVHVGTATSAAADLYVYANTTPPSVVSASTFGYDSIVQITLSAEVTPNSATNVANYSISGGVSVLKASLDPSGTVVTLQTSHFNTQSAYTLTISGVTDYATTPNVVNATVPFGPCLA